MEKKDKRRGSKSLVTTTMVELNFFLKCYSKALKSTALPHKKESKA